jgi:hypothetical protein
MSNLSSKKMFEHVQSLLNAVKSKEKFNNLAFVSRVKNILMQSKYIAHDQNVWKL